MSKKNIQADYDNTINNLQDQKNIYKLAKIIYNIITSNLFLSLFKNLLYSIFPSSISGSKNILINIIFNENSLYINLICI